MSPPAEERVLSIAEGAIEQAAAGLRVVGNDEREPCVAVPAPAAGAETVDASAFVSSLAVVIVEILAGVRPIEQLSRWVTDSVYRDITIRATLARQNRAMTGTKPRRPSFHIGTIVAARTGTGSSSRHECVAIIHQARRCRAIAICIEFVRGRWRANSISVL